MRWYLLLILSVLLNVMPPDTNKVSVGKLLDEMIHRSTLAEPVSYTHLTLPTILRV